MKKLKGNAKLLLELMVKHRGEIDDAKKEFMVINNNLSEQEFNNLFQKVEDYHFSQSY